MIAASKSVKTVSSSSVLSGLRFSTASKPSKAQEVRSPREVVLEFLDQQIAMAKADLEGVEYSVKRVRFQKDDDGKSKKVEVSVVPRRSYWQQGSEWLASLKYGNVVVELSPGHPSVVAGSTLKDVVETFGVLQSAVKSGEVDSAIEATVQKAKRKQASPDSVAA